MIETNGLAVNGGSEVEDGSMSIEIIRKGDRLGDITILWDGDELEVKVEGLNGGSVGNLSVDIDEFYL